MPLGPLPSLGPFGRVVDVRVYPHGLVGGGNNLGQGAGLARPNLSSDAWYAAGLKYGGNVLWPGSSPRYTLAYAGPRYRLFGKLEGGGFSVWRNYAVLNGALLFGPGPKVLGAGIRVYDNLPTTVGAYTGTGDGTLTLATPATGEGAVTGTWRVRCIEGGAAARFELVDPDDVSRGTVDMGVLFDGPVRFTVTPGAIAFVSGDQWPVDVEQREQIILLCQSVNGDDPVPDLLYRRARDSATAWRLVGSVAPIAGAAYPTPSPWTINASGTHAATVRIIGGAFTRCILNLATLTIDQHVISAPVISVVRSDGTWSTPDPGPHETIIAAEYAGDTLREWVVVAQGHKTGNQASGGTIEVAAQLEIRGAGGGVAPLWELAASVGFDGGAPGTPSSGTTLTFTRHVYAWGHGDVPIGSWPVTIMTGTVSVADGVGLGTDENGFEFYYRTVSADYALTSPGGSVAVADFTAQYYANDWRLVGATPSSTWELNNTGSPWRPYTFNGGDFGPSADIVEELFAVRGLGWARLGGSGNVSDSAQSISFVSGGWFIFGNDYHFSGQNDELFPAWIGSGSSVTGGVLWSVDGVTQLSSLNYSDRASTGAADGRGNYMIAIEDVDYNTRTPSPYLIDMATGTGNMLLFTGGPDALTNATVHTLVGSATNQLVAVGTF